MSSSKKAAELLSAGRFIVAKTAPYFIPVLNALIQQEHEGLDTIAVSDRGFLIYDPAFIAGQSPKVVAGLLIHEAFHLVNKHGRRRGKRHAGYWNRACDRSINPGVLQLGLELPTGQQAGCFPKDLGMPDGLTADEYYRAEVERAQQQAQQGGQGAPQQGQGQPKGSSAGSGDEGDGEPGDEDGSGLPEPPKGSVGAGHCGSCAGHAHDGEPGDEEQARDGRSDVQLDRLARQTFESMKDYAAKNPGRVPGGWVRTAEAELGPAKVPWRQTLARLVRSAAGWRPGAQEHRYDGPSRRQAGLGYGPGRPVLARLRQPIPEVDIILDTSGSMTGALVNECLREMSGILKGVGAKVNLCVCDAEVHGLQRIESVEQAVRMLKGGGGTDFCPAFDALAKRRPRSDVIIVLTDGYAKVPREAPPGVTVIWCLTGKHVALPAQYGQAVALDDNVDVSQLRTVHF